ncbi:type I-E CRISPR-associated protein Cas7/Cse4/CasC [Salmonella enterica subsp. enterica]|nr:type I-E CRISPR-associated protein Cas7/Cse4/CasC [Salmonella enterica subsp. enterica]
MGAALAHRLAEETRAKRVKSLHRYVKISGCRYCDVSGRMLANKPDCNVEAACQVAHAFGVSETIVEDDFFTVVDDLRQHGQKMAAQPPRRNWLWLRAVFTPISCIDKDLLVKT